MPRKLLNDVDGFTVDEHAGTFSGTFDVRGSDARYLAYDDEVLLVVRARVKPPRLKENRHGEITRVNVLAVKEAGVVRSDKLKQHLCDALGLDMPEPQLPFDDSGAPAAPADDIPEPAELEDLPSEDETEVEEEPEEPTAIFVPFTADPGPGQAEKRLVSSTRDARLAAFLSEA